MRRFSLLLLTALLLGGCGQTGALYLPEPAADNQAPAVTPAPTATEQTN
ncbi:lipoprotein [uncultured Ferrimonas sp.]|nr:lipoprotein [uncultured Ferrimonas sp.]